VLFRDLRDLVANLMQLAFFLTPVIYSMTAVDSQWMRALLHLNPMTPFVLAYQDVFYFGQVPGSWNMALILVYTLASSVIGFGVFERLRDTLAEAI
jgi:lipopolysaccharide transport system permease protein